MRRREFVGLIGGAAVAWPLAAHAQQPALPVIGFLNSASPEPYAHLVDAFRRGLVETGYIESRNVAIEYRWADGQYDRLPALAADLASRQVAVIAATGGDPSALAAKTATMTIPIVFNTSSDPVRLGLIDSLSRPSGNLTGISQLLGAITGKQLELLSQLVPNAVVIAFLVNPNNPNAEDRTREMHEAARAVGRQLLVVTASTEADLEPAFATVQRNAGALSINADAFFLSRREQLVALAARHALPMVAPFREFAVSGSLISYGNNTADAYRQVGIYAGKILKGAKPADLPIQQVTKIEFVINLKTAKTLGLTVPLPLLGRADEVIE